MHGGSRIWNFTRVRARIEATPGVAMIVRDLVGSTARIETTSFPCCNVVALQWPAREAASSAAGRIDLLAPAHVGHPA